MTACVKAPHQAPHRCCYGPTGISVLATLALSPPKPEQGGLNPSAQGFPRGDLELLQEAGVTRFPFSLLCQREGWNLTKPIPPGKPTGDGHRSVGPLFHTVYLQKVDRLWSPGIPFVPCRKVSATSGF